VTSERSKVLGGVNLKSLKCQGKTLGKGWLKVLVAAWLAVPKPFDMTTSMRMIYIEALRRRTLELGWLAHASNKPRSMSCTSLREKSPKIS
jgi:hypothetical protein